jgi:hypothetical protein
VLLLEADLPGAEAALARGSLAPVPGAERLQRLVPAR